MLDDTKHRLKIRSKEQWEKREVEIPNRSSMSGWTIFLELAEGCRITQEDMGVQQSYTIGKYSIVSFEGICNFQNCSAN